MEGIEFYNKNNPHHNHVFPEVTPGHHIAATPVSFHLIDDKTPDIDTMERFTIHIVKQEISILMKGQLSFKLSDIAIMFDDTYAMYCLDDFQNAIGVMLKQEYNLETTNIRDQVRNDNTDKVVFGKMEDCMSYEAPLVIFIGMGIADSMYSLLSRARTRLSLICSNTRKYICIYSSDSYLQQFIQHGTRVMWVEEKGNFTRNFYRVFSDKGR